MDECKPLPSSPLLMLTPAGAEMLTPVAPEASTTEQGLTPVHLSAQRKRFWSDKGYLGGVFGGGGGGVEALRG